MAILRDGLMGDFTGKIGNNSGSRNKSGPYMKGHCRFYKDAKTKKQVSLRKRFSYTAKYCTRYISVCKHDDEEILFKNNISYNKLFKENVNAFTDYQCYPDYPKLCFNKGPIQLPLDISIRKDEKEKFIYNISWEDNYIFDDNPDEGRFKEYATVLILVDWGPYGSFDVRRKVALRTEKSVSVDLSCWDDQSDFHFYIFFSDSDGCTFSDSVYLDSYLYMTDEDRATYDISRWM